MRLVLLMLVASACGQKRIASAVTTKSTEEVVTRIDAYDEDTQFHWCVVFVVYKSVEAQLKEVERQIYAYKAILPFSQEPQRSFIEAFYARLLDEQVRLLVTLAVGKEELLNMRLSFGDRMQDMDADECFAVVQKRVPNPKDVNVPELNERTYY